MRARHPGRREAESRDLDPHRDLTWMPAFAGMTILIGMAR